MPKPHKKVETLGRSSTRRRASRARKFRLKIVGVGGAGGNAISHIGAARAESTHLLDGADLIAVNTDLQGLETVSTAERIQIGASITHGLGAGGDPELGARAARVDLERLEHAVQRADLVFVAAGLGGGTGGGAAPLVARLAHEQGALVIGFVTLPFAFEGERRRAVAAASLEELKKHADAVICIPNDRLVKLADEQASALEAFKQGDAMVADAAQAVWQLMSRQGLINLDFASVRAILQKRQAEGLFARGEGTGPNRVATAVDQLLSHPLLDEDHALARTEGLLISLLGGPDLTLAEVQEVVDPITRLAQRANVIIGAAIDEDYRERLSVTVIAASSPLERKPVEPDAALSTNTATATAAVAEPGPEPERAASGAVAKQKQKQQKKKDAGKPRQEILPLDHVSRGRFDQSEPTIHEGQDLDVPTFLRQGTALTS